MKIYVVILTLLLTCYGKLRSQVGTPSVSKQILNDMILSIPAPVEISFLTKGLGVPSNQALLNSPNNYLNMIPILNKPLI